MLTQREVTLSIYLAHSLTRVDKIMLGVEIEKGEIVAAWENELLNAFSFEQISGFVRKEGLEKIYLSLQHVVSKRTITSYGTYYDLRRP
jgi:hypothetical protein